VVTRPINVNLLKKVCCLLGNGYPKWMKEGAGIGLYPGMDKGRKGVF
jgi:hypothetical protein